MEGVENKNLAIFNPLYTSLIKKLIMLNDFVDKNLNPVE